MNKWIDRPVAVAAYAGNTSRDPAGGGGPIELAARGILVTTPEPGPSLQVAAAVAAAVLLMRKRRRIVPLRRRTGGWGVEIAGSCPFS